MITTEYVQSMYTLGIAACGFAIAAVVFGYAWFVKWALDKSKTKKERQKNLFCKDCQDVFMNME